MGICSAQNKPFLFVCCVPLLPGAARASCTWSCRAQRRTNTSWARTAARSTACRTSSTSTPAASCPSRGPNTCPCCTPSLSGHYSSLGPPSAWDSPWLVKMKPDPGSPHRLTCFEASNRQCAAHFFFIILFITDSLSLYQRLTVWTSFHGFLPTALKEQQRYMFSVTCVIENDVLVPWARSRTTVLW